MNLRMTAALVVAMAFPVVAQTAAEQLQKGIFAQESAGKTEEAISIYRQLASSSLTPRAIAAEAQYRLSMALLQKGDLSIATREMERMERDFPDQQELVRTLASRAKTHALPMTAPQTLVPMEFETGAPTTISGKVINVSWVNPVGWLGVDVAGTKYVIRLSSPNSLMRRSLTKDTFKPGQSVTVRGLSAKDARRLFTPTP